MDSEATPAQQYGLEDKHYEDALAERRLLRRMFDTDHGKINREEWGL